MIQKHRIYTNIGRDQKVNVEILDTYDLIEILSLKFSQKDIYASGNCSEYGVVVGRISANNGFGVPNAKVSIFIPQSDLDVDDPVISKLYPYTSVIDKDENGYRYNLLPARQQHSGHAPTGTFFDQEDILTREECLEVFESYYKYTVKTNSSGDFMIWGVPVGTQVLHVDIDLSDIGCFSLRPYDFIKRGVGLDEFERYYKFKSSSDIDGLPQIISYDQTINVYPFWGNEELCEIGITRTDFDLSSKGIKIEPISLILASAVTDDNSDAVKRSGRIKKNTGYKCNLQTTSGSVECIRYTGRKVYASDGVTLYPELETLNITEVIDEDGIIMAVLPMNLEYVYTNEFGEQETTNDANKGIATTAIARFRFGLDVSDGKITTAKYLVPNIREFNPNSQGTSYGYGDDIEFNEGMLATYQFSEVFEDYITVIPPTGTTSLVTTNYGTSEKSHKKDLMLGINNNNIPEDYFYKFIYGKVYTVSSFQGSHFDGNKRDSFLGIKQIRPTADEDCASSANYFPTNFGFKNRAKFNLILSQVLLFLQYIVTVIFVKIGELLGKFFYAIHSFFYGLGLGSWRPFRRFSEQLEDLAYRIQDRFTQQLPLTIYPDCEECSTVNESVISDTSYADSYCRMAEIKMEVHLNYSWGPNINAIGFVVPNNLPPTDDIWRNTITDSTFLTGVTETSNFFPGEYARDPDSPCVGAPALDFSALDMLSDVTNLIYIDGLGTVPRYVVEIYGWANVTGQTIISEYVSNLQSPIQSSEDITFVDYGGNWQVTYPSDVFEELTGINNSDPFVDTYLYVVIRIYDRAYAKEVILTGTTTTEIEEGCTKYDKTYNEGIRMSYIWSSGTTYGSTYLPLHPSSGVYLEDPTYMESILPDAIRVNLLSTVIGRTGALRMPRYVPYRRIGRGIYDRKTKSGYSEFRDGEFTIIPVIRGRSNNTPAIQEWYRRKRIGLSFCGGVVNYSFIDNWLNGLLYFFKFDKRVRWDNEDIYDLNQRGTRYPRELVFFNILDKNFYYRSTPYNLASGFIGQTNPTSGAKEILHPTTFYDVGVRDEFLYEICYDPAVDPACSVIRDIGSTSYQDAANIVEYAINYRMDITNSNFDINDFFDGPAYNHRIKVFDGDITQLISINCEAGIEAFDLDSPHYYMYNDEYLDPEDINFAEYFKSGNDFGPTPIDLKFDSNGAHIRMCLNNRLGDYSQTVPFYLWDKGGTGFGGYGPISDDQAWDKTAIASMPLQRMFSISGVTETTIYDSLFLRIGRTNYLMPDGEEEYLLMPMTIDHSTFSVTGSTVDILERFEIISYYPADESPNGALQYIEGDLWLYVTLGSIKDPQKGLIYVVVNKTWTLQPYEYVKGDRETFIFQTVQNYDGRHQVLSSPFLFYFGLRPGNSALDLLIKYFGPKGAFSTGVVGCPIPDITPTPSPIPPTPTVTVTATPIVTPTPYPPEAFYYRLVKCVEGYIGNYYYAQSLSGYLSSGNLVWGGVNCDPNYAYIVAGSTTTEQDYIDLGYMNIGIVSLDSFGHSACVDCEGNPIAPPTTPTPPAFVAYGVYLISSYGSSILACAGGSPTGTLYMPEGHYPPVPGDYIYNDSDCTDNFIGDGNWYRAIRNGIWYALQITASGLVNDVVNC